MSGAGAALTSKSNTANHEIQGGHTGRPLPQDGIVRHGPTYGTMQTGGIIIGLIAPNGGIICEPMAAPWGLAGAIVISSGRSSCLRRGVSQATLNCNVA